MVIDFFDPEILYMVPPQTASSPTHGKLPAGVHPLPQDPAGKITGMELRMLPPYIKDNRTERIFPFPGYANLYCLTIVVSNVANELVGSMDLSGFARIGDKEYLPVNKTLFYWQAEKQSDKAPVQLHMMCSIIKSKQGLRDTGKLLAGLKEDVAFKSITERLRKMTKDTSSFLAVTDIINGIAGLVGRQLGAIEDKPLATVYNSYTNVYGDFDQEGVTPLTYTTRYVDFNFKLVVRKKESAKTSDKHLPELKETPEMMPL